ncbi:MAG: GNAT family N-acetyltransferase [Solobacterium sp.]|nr:GNAT family N-acetyltransferase [Solobacterium sp.]
MKKQISICSGDVMRRWTIKRFEELSAYELYGLLKLRQDVFIVEQECIYPDLDDIDYHSVHIFTCDADKRVSAYARIFENADGKLQVGRVCTKERGIGLGGELLEEVMRFIKQELKRDDIVLEAQTYAVGFYEREGFAVVSDEFLEDGIPHVRMEYGGHL